MSIKFADVVLEVVDPMNVQPVSADLYTEARNYNGVVCLSFAAIVADGDAQAIASVVSRIRLTLPGAMDLRNALDRLLKETMPGKENAN